MAKFETNVAGVTFYDVDFSSISPSSKVEIVPEPENPHDSNALKVIIDGKHVGYIKRTLSTFLAQKIADGVTLKAKVKAIVGGSAYKNYGIILSISLLENYNHRSADQELGEFVAGKIDVIRYMVTPHPIKIFVGQKPSWESFLEDVKDIPKKVKEPKEPDYQKLYKMEVPFWKRLFSYTLAKFTQEKRREWMTLCHIAREQNKLREALIKKISGYKYKEEYQSYIYSKQIEQCFRKHGIVIKTEIKIDEMIKDGYITSYEQVLYENLKLSFPVYRQITINDYSFDLIVAVPQTNKLWIIEVDGVIHRRKRIIEKDHEKDNLVLRNGISLIRVTNYYIKRNLEEVLNKITTKILESSLN